LRLFSVCLLTQLICSLLVLGGSYAVPMPADEVTSSNVTEYKTETLANLTLYYDEDYLLLDNPTSEN